METRDGLFTKRLQGRKKIMCMFSLRHSQTKQPAFFKINCSTVRTILLTPQLQFSHTQHKWDKVLPVIQSNSWFFYTEDSGLLTKNLLICIPLLYYDLWTGQAWVLKALLGKQTYRGESYLKAIIYWEHIISEILLYYHLRRRLSNSVKLDYLFIIEMCKGEKYRLCII